MKLIVGLGNPGAQYEKTRHNVGFWAVRRLAEVVGTRIGTAKFRALIGEGRRGNERIILLLPQTYMNLSGESVQQAAAFYKVPVEDIIVVSDDLDLPQGKLRIRQNGSHGGHNGLRSIMTQMGSQEFSRIKIGIGRPKDSRIDAKDWVLSQCTPDDTVVLREAADKAASAVISILEDGLDKAMNNYNKEPKPPKPPKPKPAEGIDGTVRT